MNRKPFPRWFCCAQSFNPLLLRPLVFAWFYRLFFISVGVVSEQWKKTRFFGAAGLVKRTTKCVTIALHCYIAMNGGIPYAYSQITCGDPPRIVTHPLDRTLQSGSTLSVGVTASGTAPLEYQWYRNGAPLAGETNGIYTKTNVAWFDSGLYSVKVTDPCGQSVASTEGVVAIADAPYSVVNLTNQVWQYNDEGDCPSNTWKDVIFAPAETWKSGRGIFAREQDASTLAALAARGGTNTVLNLSNGAVGVATYYFRTSFVLTKDPASAQLFLTNVIDDSAVIYLNGILIGLIEMPTVTPNCLTLTSRSAVEGVFRAWSVSASAFVTGTNVLAAEVHQGFSGDTDVAFGLSLGVHPMAPTKLAFGGELTDATLPEGGVIRFNVFVDGVGGNYQWFKDGVPISGATRATLTISNATVADTGDYWFQASNALSCLTTRRARASVVVDTSPPYLLGATNIDATHVLLSFSEPLLASTAETVVNYRIADVFGNTFAAVSAVLTNNGTNVLLTTSARPEWDCLVTVSNVVDNSPRHLQIATNSVVPVATWVTVFPYDATWLVFDPVPPVDDPDPGEAWKQDVFLPPDTWVEGPGMFFYGIYTNGFPAAVNSNLRLSAAYTSYYRREFVLSPSRAGLRLFADLCVNDGVVVYLNGSEALRTNMPSGQASSGTEALPAWDLGALVKTIQIPGDALRPGTNVIAVELHQKQTNDPQKVFGMRLRAQAESRVGGPITVWSELNQLTVKERDPVMLMATAMGAEFFQWRVNEVDVPSATSPLFAFSATLDWDGARISVVLSNSDSVVVSTNAILRVVPDTTPPTIVSGAINSNRITLSFSEPLAEGSATNVSHYLVTNRMGVAQNVASATLINGTNVILAFADLPMGPYGVIVNGVSDTALKANPVEPLSGVMPGFTYVAIPMSGWWRYTHAVEAQSWTSLIYDDKHWQGSSQALFGAKSGAMPPLPEPLRTPADLGLTTHYYFRTDFSPIVAGPAQFESRIIVGNCSSYTVYLNGSKVRWGGNLPGGYCIWELPTTVHITKLNTANVNVLAGTNVVAVEVFQSQSSYPEFFWAGEFSISAAPVLIPPPCSPISWISPRLYYQRAGSNVVLSWQSPVTNGEPCNTSAVFMLQQRAGNPPQDWTDVTNMSPVTMTTTNQESYFRLRLP